MAFYFNCSRQCRNLGFKKYLILNNNLQSTSLVTTAARQVTESFEEKNKKLERPLSPHLSIYKFPLPAVLSITHRATGLVLTGGLYGLSIGMLILPANFPYYFEKLQSLHLGSPLIVSLKFALAWTLFYHTFNGIRHLAWDMGYGFDLKNLYLSGYAVLGTSTAASVIAALL